MRTLDKYTTVTRIVTDYDQEGHVVGAHEEPVNSGRKDNRVAGRLAGELAPLGPTAEDKRQARHALLGLLAGETSADTAERLADGLARLDPTVHDLRTWRAWAVPPTAELLAAVRRNSALTSWFAALPSLTSLSDSPA